MVQWYRKHFLAIELGIAILFTMIVAVFAPRCAIVHPLLEGLRQPNSPVYSTIVGLGGTLLGFAMTALTIVLALSSLPHFHLLRDSGQMPVIAQIYRQMIGWLAGMVLWSLIGLVISSPGPLPDFFAVIEFGLIVMVSLRIYRGVWVLLIMLKLSQSPHRDSV